MNLIIRSIFLSVKILRIVAFLLVFVTNNFVYSEGVEGEGYAVVHWREFSIPAEVINKKLELHLSLMQIPFALASEISDPSCCIDESSIRYGYKFFIDKSWIKPREKLNYD